jgi:alkanesulfonate monooxygenase SsuD/methylene tetrahydromethanopterin reductase-like flavin-dependent oxidoreductase (luciferase family)
MLAKKATTVDEISGGRLILGLGAGWNEAEYRAYGFPFDRRVSRFDEAFTIIRTLLRERRCEFSGTFYRLEDCELLPRGPREDGPPLMVGSIGERMLRITLPHVSAWNAWFTWFGNDINGYRTMRQRVDDACRAVGRDPATLERTVALFIAFPGAQGRQLGDLSGPGATPIPGEPEAIAAALQAFAREGVAHVQLVLDPITLETIVAIEPALRLLDA